MRRRDFIALLGTATVTWPRTLVAQGRGELRRIGVLMELAASDPQARSNVAALQRGLYKLGWSQGGNLGIDYRWAPDDAVLMWKFAKELVELRPDVIVAHSSPVVTTLLSKQRLLWRWFTMTTRSSGFCCSCTRVRCWCSSAPRHFYHGSSPTGHRSSSALPCADRL